MIWRVVGFFICEGIVVYSCVNAGYIIGFDKGMKIGIIRGVMKEIGIRIKECMNSNETVTKTELDRQNEAFSEWAELEGKKSKRLQKGYR